MHYKETSPLAAQVVLNKSNLLMRQYLDRSDIYSYRDDSIVTTCLVQDMFWK